MEEVHALAQHVAVRQPAGAHGEIAAQALVRNGFGDEIEQRQHDEDERGHDDQLGTIILPEGGAVGGGEEIDEIAEKGEEIDLDQRDHRRKCDGSGKQRQERARIMPGKGQEPGRRLVRLWRWKRIDAGLKPAENAVKHGEISWRAMAYGVRAAHFHRWCGCKLNL